MGGWFCGSLSVVFPNGLNRVRYVFVLFYNLFFSPSFRVLHRRFGWFLSFMCWGQLLVHSVVVSGWFCGLCSCRFTYLLSVVCLVLLFSPSESISVVLCALVAVFGVCAVLWRG